MAILFLLVPPKEPVIRYLVPVLPALIAIIVRYIEKDLKVQHSVRALVVSLVLAHMFGATVRAGVPAVARDEVLLTGLSNGINKLAAEMYYTLYHRVYGIRTVSLRLTNTYGPRMDIETGRKGFVGVFLRKALDGETIQVYGTGDQRRDFNYIDDVLSALLLAGEQSELFGGVYNLGHPRTYSLNEFVETLGELCPFACRRVPFPEDSEIIDIGDYSGDFTRFADATGWQPEVDLDEGLRRTVEFFRQARGGPTGR